MKMEITKRTRAVANTVRVRKILLYTINVNVFAK